MTVIPDYWSYFREKENYIELPVQGQSMVR